jgi:hypothetical protein
MLIEQISYNINWRNFKAGTSFFVPCLNCTQAKEEVLRVTKRLKIEVLIKISIEDGVKGLRVWKT